MSDIPMASRPNRIIFECPPKLRARLESYAQHTGFSQAEIIRAAMHDYLPDVALTEYLASVNCLETK